VVFLKLQSDFSIVLRSRFLFAIGVAKFADRLAEAIKPSSQRDSGLTGIEALVKLEFLCSNYE